MLNVQAYSDACDLVLALWEMLALASMRIKDMYLFTQLTCLSGRQDKFENVWKDRSSYCGLIITIYIFYILFHFILRIALRKGTLLVSTFSKAYAYFSRAEIPTWFCKDVGELSDATRNWAFMIFVWSSPKAPPYIRSSQERSVDYPNIYFSPNSNTEKHFLPTLEIHILVGGILFPFVLPVCLDVYGKESHLLFILYYYSPLLTLQSSHHGPFTHSLKEAVY